MSFTLRIYFDGLLHYVENSSGSDVRLCIVLPNAPDHEASITAALGTNLVGANARKIDIDGKRVVLQLGGVDHTSKLDFEKNIMGGSVKGAVPLERIAGAFADHDLKIVSRMPPKTVRSQVLIGPGGSFHLAASASPPEIDLPGNLLHGGSISRLTMAEAFFMEAENVEWARLIVLPLDDVVDRYTAYPITSSLEGTVVITLSQTCQARGAAHLGDEDKDFRQLYMLLGALPPGRRLETMPAPIIQKFSKPTEAFMKEHPALQLLQFTPTGCNCAGSRGLKRSYNLDKFMDIQPPP